ncbi:peptidoglycan/LPS O-acetylase OafA/YrhL [Neisseria sp. HSC-16F19]|nr:peptidoglycan/LPS O-acetylase OafA/YrhL [Neisseria sp. HSC-16F19]
MAYILKFRNDIQGLRAIAVLAVIAFHFDPQLLPAGFVGVDVFFVLSGFLITQILLTAKFKEGYSFKTAVRTFYSSRIKRIFPAYLFMLFIVLIGASILFTPIDFKTFLTGYKSALGFLSNYYFSRFGDYFSPGVFEQPLVHTWSLAVELQFYLFIPLIILLMPIKWLKLFLVSILCTLLIWSEYRLSLPANSQAVYYSFFARVPEFIVGILAAIYAFNGRIIHPKFALAGAVALVCSLFFQKELGAFPGIRVILPVVATALILVASPEKNSIKRFLSTPIMLLIGALSYSLYLWHWPVLAFIRYITNQDKLNLTAAVVFILLTTGFSTLSYMFIEKPFRKHKRAVIGTIMGIGLLVTFVPVFKLVHHKLSPPDLGVELTRYADPQSICHSTINGDCIRGDSQSLKEILVLGDSHAAMLNLFFDYLGKQNRFKAQIITASSCVPIEGFDVERIAAWAQNDCLRQIEYVKPLVEKQDIIVIAAYWSWQLPSDTFRTALEDFVKRYPNKQILVLPQVPVQAMHPQREYRFKHLGIPVIKSHITEAEYANAQLEALLAPYSWVKFLGNEQGEALDVLQKDFPSNLSVLYYDRHHLNEVGAVEYAVRSKNMKKLLESALNN